MPEQITAVYEFTVKPGGFLAYITDVVDGLIDEDACAGKLISNILRHVVIRFQPGKYGLPCDQTFQLSQPGNGGQLTFANRFQINAQFFIQCPFNVFKLLEQGLFPAGKLAQAIFRGIAIEGMGAVLAPEGRADNLDIRCQEMRDIKCHHIHQVVCDIWRGEHILAIDCHQTDRRGTIASQIAVAALIGQIKCR